MLIKDRRSGLRQRICSVFMMRQPSTIKCSSASVIRARTNPISAERFALSERLSDSPDSYAAADVAAYIIGKGLQSTVDEILALQGKTLAQIKADPALKATWDACIGWWQSEPNEELDFFVAKKDYPVIGYDGNVGVYQDGDYGIVVCYTTSEAFLKEDGSLSYLAAYELGDLPLVKKSLFESCRIEPAEGQTLATNKYQTDLASSASWGPYKLTQYQSGKSYTLSKNDNWYGYNLKDNTNQYNVNAIKCDVMAETSTQWMAFLNG